MKIQAQLSLNKFRHDQDTDAHLVLSITAPTKDGEEARPHLCVIAALDASGSMQGAKLDYAKKSAVKLIEHLKPGDYCGIVVFESRAHICAKPELITAESKSRLIAAVNKIQVMGGTNFTDGMLTAINLIQKLDLPSEYICRVIMLTDGQANEGVETKPAGMLRLLKANAGRVTASAFGYGQGAGIDHQFLLDFAKEGQGNFAAIKNPDDALSAFGKELGGLLSTYATDLQLNLDPLAAHEVTSVVTDVESETETFGGNITIKIPNILSEETRNIVLAIKLKAQKAAFPRAVNVFDLKLGYDFIDAAGKKERKSLEAKAKAQFVKAGEEDSTPDKALDSIIALAEVIRAQIDAEAAAKKGNYVQTQQIMADVAQRTRLRGQMGAAAAAVVLGDRMADEGAYTSNQVYLRSFQSGGTRGMGGTYTVEAADQLQNLGVVLSNDIQANTRTSFGGPVVVDPPPVVVDSVKPIRRSR